MPSQLEDDVRQAQAHMARNGRSDPVIPPTLGALLLMAIPVYVLTVDGPDLGLSAPALLVYAAFDFPSWLGAVLGLAWLAGPMFVFLLWNYRETRVGFGRSPRSLGVMASLVLLNFAWMGASYMNAPWGVDVDQRGTLTLPFIVGSVLSVLLLALGWAQWKTRDHRYGFAFRWATTAWLFWCAFGWYRPLGI